MNSTHQTHHTTLFPKVSFSFLTCSFLLTGCGGDSSSDNAIQTKPINTTEVSLTLLQNNKSQSVHTTNSSATTIEDGQQNAPYLYNQIYERVNNQFQKNLDFNYTFNANSTEYKVRAVYNDLKSQPNYFFIQQKNAQNEEFFSCHEDYLVCNGISVNVDEKTGQTTLKFNQTSIQNDKNSIVINGQITGKLAQAPTVVNIPTSLQHQLIESSISDFANPYTIANTNYQQMVFTNHNQVYLSTGFDNNPSPMEVYIFNNKVNKAISYAHPVLRAINWAFDDSINATNPPSYDAKNYIVTFNQTKFDTTNAMSTYYPTAYLKGSIGP